VEKHNSFQKVFVVREANDSGLMAFNIYIRGKPQVVVIDDVIPFLTNQGNFVPAFA
jgi:hypothetical protein